MKNTYRKLTRVAVNEDGSFGGIWAIDDDVTTGQLLYHLAEYEELGTPDDIRKLMKEASTMLKNNKRHKKSIKDLSNSNTIFYKENQQLKTQQKQLAVEKLEELKTKLENAMQRFLEKTQIDKKTLDYVDGESFLYANKRSALSEVVDKINSMINELKGE